MAFTKKNEFLHLVPVWTGGVVTDAQALMHVTITENGVDTQLTYVASLSALPALTPTQKTQLASILTVIRDAALLVDVPIPLVN